MDKSNRGIKAVDLLGAQSEAVAPKEDVNLVQASNLEAFSRHVQQAGDLSDADA